MKKSSWCLVTAGYLLSAVCGRADQCGAVAANLVANCGFETGSFSSWTLSGVQSSPAYLGISHGVDTADAHTGADGAYLGGFGGILDLSQFLATVPGTLYEVDYWLAQSPATVAPYQSSFNVTFGGTTLFSAGNAPNLPFTRYEFFTTAAASLSNLQFGARDDTGFFSLDDISVEPAPAPEPGTNRLLLSATALLLVGFVARTLVPAGDIAGRPLISRNVTAAAVSPLTNTRSVFLEKPASSVCFSLPQALFDFDPSYQRPLHKQIRPYASPKSLSGTSRADG